MKKLLYPIAFALTAFLIAYSCSAEEEDTTPPPSVVKPTTPEPEPEPEVTQYTLTVTAGEGGTVSTEGGTYDEGTEVTITATPELGYQFVGWDGTNSNTKSITFSINNNVTLTAQFVYIPPFESFSESYLGITESVGNILRQKNTDVIFSPNDVFNKLWLDNCDICYIPMTKASIQYDFFGDGYVDFFGFYNYPGEGEYGVYVLIEDIRINPKPAQIFESTFFAINKALPIDIENDGNIEILFFSDNSHTACRDGNSKNNYSDLPLIVKIEKSNELISVNENRIGESLIHTHDGTSGDVDNDGDTDIVIWPNAANSCTITQRLDFPIILINNGLGDFSEKPFFEDEATLRENWLSWKSLSYSMADLDNDGYLDIVSGRNIGLSPFGIDPPPEKDATDLLPFIIWGSNNGFLSENITFLEDVLFKNQINRLYGIGFTDYNNDNELDIILTSYSESNTNDVYDEDNYLIQIFKNKSNRTFENKTESTFDNYYSSNNDGYTNFYTPLSIDYDKDGDFDIIAQDIHFFSSNIDENLIMWWENTGGKFVRREND